MSLLNINLIVYLLRVTSNFQVMVFDYSGSFHNLSPQEIDNILMHSNLEECILSIDSSLSRALEINMQLKKTRAQRDLGELQCTCLQVHTMYMYLYPIAALFRKGGHSVKILDSETSLLHTSLEQLEVCRLSCIREVSSFHSVLIRDASILEDCPFKLVPPGIVLVVDGGGGGNVHLVMVVNSSCFVSLCSPFSSPARHEASRREPFCCVPSIPFLLWFSLHVGGLLCTTAGATGKALHHTQTGCS